MTSSAVQINVVKGCMYKTALTQPLTTFIWAVEYNMRNLTYIESYINLLKINEEGFH